MYVMCTSLHKSGFTYRYMSAYNIVHINIIKSVCAYQHQRLHDLAAVHKFVTITASATPSTCRHFRGFQMTFILRHNGDAAWKRFVESGDIGRSSLSVYTCLVTDRYPRYWLPYVTPWAEPDGDISSICRSLKWVILTKCISDLNLKYWTPTSLISIITVKRFQFVTEKIFVKVTELQKMWLNTKRMATVRIYVGHFFRIVAVRQQTKKT